MKLEASASAAVARGLTVYIVVTLVVALGLLPRESVTVIHKLQLWAKTVKRDVLAVYLAARDPRVPWYAKALALFTAAYALSPIDLIPDFIPILGYLDDVIILPLAIALTVRMIPKAVLDELRLEAERRLSASPPASRTAAAVVILIWIALAAGAIAFLVRSRGP